MARAADRRPRVPDEPELTYVWVAQLRTELRTALPRPVASPGWRRLPFATPPTAGAAYEQWHCDHPADDAADDQPPRAGSGPDNCRPMIMMFGTTRRPL